MAIYNIAGLNVELTPLFDTLKKQAMPYLSHDAKSDICAIMSEADIIAKQKENPHLTLSDCEYIWTSAMFYNSILDFDGFMLHSSAICYENQAYVFSAPSGTGKSTHAELWQKCFGYDKVKIINDDKPVIRLADSEFYVYGTPWSGKSDKNSNIKVPLHAICILHRSEQNEIGSLANKNAIYSILDQTLRPAEPDKIDKLLTLLDDLLRSVPVYSLGCNMTTDAAQFAYEQLQLSNN